MIAWPPGYYSLPADQQALLEKLAAEYGDDLQHQLMVQSLLEPGLEKAFLVRYFPHRLEDELEDFHLRLIDTALTVPRGLVLFPAGHGKTTLISGLLPILAAIRDPNIRIAIIAKNEEEGDGIGATIMAELTDNPLLNDDFGPFRPDDGDQRRPWRNGWFSVRQRTRVGKEPTIAIFGSGAKNILGHRTDWVICDDVVTEKNSSTPAQRDTMRIWFETSVETSPEKLHRGQVNGRLTVVGTMFHPHDLYWVIKTYVDSEGKLAYKFHREDAIRDEIKQEPLWPDRYTWKDLMDIKAKGTLSFNKRYRNKPVDESEQIVKEDWIKGRGGKGGCLDWQRTAGEIEEGWSFGQGFDPAVGSSKSAKFCGQIVVAVPAYARDQRLIILVNRAQLTLPQQVDTIIETHQAYPNMSVSVVEVNAYQKGLYQAIQDKCSQRGITINVQPHTTGLNKLDPAIGLGSLSPLVEQAKLRFPYGDEYSRRMSDMLIEEMIEYPFFAYTDLMMALWFIHLKLNMAMPQYKAGNRLARNRSHYHMRNMVRNPIYALQDHVGTGPLQTEVVAPDDMDWGRDLKRIDEVARLPHPDRSLDDDEG